MAEKYSEIQLKKLNKQLDDVIIEYEKALKKYDKIRGLYQQMAMMQNQVITDEDIADLAPDEYNAVQSLLKKRDNLKNKINQYNSSSLKNRVGHSAEDIARWQAEAHKSKDNETGSDWNNHKYKSAEASASVFMNPENFNGKQFFGELWTHFKDGNAQGIKETLKATPKSLKLFTGVVGIATTAVTVAVKAVNKLVKTFEESAEKFRQVTNLSVRNNTADSGDIAKASNIEHINTIKARLDELKNNIDSFVLGLAGALADYEKWWTNRWNNSPFGKFAPIDMSKFDNADAQSTALQRDTALQTAINSARSGGADNKTAKILGGKSSSLIDNIMNSGKDGLTYDSVADAINKAIFSGDTSGLQGLGFSINDYNLKAGLYEQGFDVSGNTKYMNSALAGGRLSALEKLVGLTDLQLQEMTQQGLVLDSINQNFAWESVEAISTVNTDAGHYNSNGDFVVSDNISQGLEDVSQSLDNTSDKISNFFSASHGGKVAGYKTLAETSGTILGQRILSENYDYSSFPSLMIDKNSGLFNKSSQSNIKIDVAVESNDEKLKAYVKNIVQDENYKSANQSFSPTNSGNPNFKHRIDGLSFK